MATTMPWGEQITVLMELGFPVKEFILDTATLDGDFYLDGTLEGLDVSEYCQDIRIVRGRPDQLQSNNAGTVTINLDNTDRRFDPINESSPYWDATLGRSGVTPRRKVTVRSGTTDLFVGRITDIDIGYEPTRPSASFDLSMATITASDDFVLLANTFIQSDITPVEELTGARVTSILDLPEVNYPATRNVDTGTAVVGGGAPFLIEANTNVLTYLQEVATAEQGYFFIGADGTLVFTDRVAATFDGPTAFFSDAGSNIKYSGLDVVYGQEFLYNKVIAQTVNGTPQIANDVASQTEFGISTLSLGDLLLSTDAAALALAETLLDRYKQPLYRFDRLRVDLHALSAGDRLTVNGLELADIVNITRTYNVGTPSSVDLDCSIEAVVHTITQTAHTVEFGLADVEILLPFTLDDAIQGILDALNALT